MKKELAFWMLITALFLGILVLLTVGCASVGCSARREETLNKALASVVVVSVRYPGGGGAAGSGTVVARLPGGSLVLTCDHVTDNGSSFMVWDSNADGYSAKLYRADPRLDLALLFVPDVQLPVSKIADKEPGRYSLLYTLAAPYMQHWSASAAFLADMNYVLKFPQEPESPRNGAIVWQLTGGFFGPGASGGAVLNEAGELVCVVESSPFSLVQTVAAGDIVPITLTAVGECIPLVDVKRIMAEASL